MPLTHIEPENYDALLAQKVSRVSQLLAPYFASDAEVYSSEPLGFRMRAEFRMWHDGDDLNYVMYRPDDRKTPVPIAQFSIADAAITQLMQPLLDNLKSTQALRHKLFQVEFLATTAGDVLVTLIYHRKLDEDWEDAARGLQAQLSQTAAKVWFVGRSRKQKIVLDQDYVTEHLNVRGRTYSYQQIEQSFTQPNATVNTKMIEWACKQADALDGDLLELYCGNGNFTLPLSVCFDQVIATELSKTSTRAALANVRDNQIANTQIIRLSAEEVAQAMAGKREFRRLRTLAKPLDEYSLNTLFVDPPRAGLDDATVSMASAFQHIIYISCNPETLARNLETLSKTHRVTALAQFDQFPYTHHMECGVMLEKHPV
ncbi:MAG: tRNA (uridine(54)-C5)-methyltransferase TrmA [Halioglobus sp.]